MSPSRTGRAERHDLKVSEKGRVGAHRPRTGPLSSLWPYLLVGAVVVLVAGLGYLLLGRGDSTTTLTDTGADTGAGTSAASASGAAVSPTPAASASSPGPSSAQASQPAAAAGTVNKKTTLNFYNGSSPNIPGLSRKAAAVLQGQGWTIGEIETWTGTKVSRTTVFYSSDDQLATANEVVKKMGVGAAEKKTDLTKAGLSVVISNDYRG